MDVAADGMAAVTYVKKVGGVDHAFVARFDGTTWGAPVRLDPALAAPSKGLSVSIARGGRTVVTFVNGAADGSANAAISPGAGQPFQLVAITAGATHKDVRLDMNDEGVAYAAVTSQGGGGSDVSAYRLLDSTWSAVKTDDGVPTAVLDKTPINGAGGAGTQTSPAIGVTPSGNAAIAFPEDTGGGNADVIVRRIDGLVAKAAQVADLATLGVAPASVTMSDMISVAAESDSRVWVAFRQSFTYGLLQKPRIIVRPLDGVVLGTAQNPDGLGTSPAEGAEYPEVRVNAAGQGLLGTPRQLSSQVWGSTLAAGSWAPGARLDVDPASTGAPRPVPALGADGTGLVAWTHTTATSSEVRARVRLAGGTFGAAVALSDPTLGPIVAGDPSIAAGVDKTGRGLIAWAQGPPTAVRLVVARTDGPPPPPVVTPPTTTPPPVPATILPFTPTHLTGLTLSPKSFRALKSGGALTKAGGSLVSFSLDKAGPVSLRIERRLAGRLGRRGTCVGLKGARPSAKPCTRWVAIISVRVSGVKGSNRVHLSGRARGAALAPGIYRLTLTPNGPSTRRRFTILPARLG